MKNIIELIKAGAKKLYYVINPNDKKTKQKLLPEKVFSKKQKKPMKKTSALFAASMGRCAVDAVRHHSAKKVLGSSDYFL